MSSLMGKEDRGQGVVRGVLRLPPPYAVAGTTILISMIALIRDDLKMARL